MRFYIDFDEKGAAFRWPKGAMHRPATVKSLKFPQLFRCYPRPYLAGASIDDRTPLPAARLTKRSVLNSKPTLYANPIALAPTASNCPR